MTNDLVNQIKKLQSNSEELEVDCKELHIKKIVYCLKIVK